MHDDTSCQNRQIDTLLSCLLTDSPQNSFNHYYSAAFTSGIFNTSLKKPKRGDKMTHTVLQ